MPKPKWKRKYKKIIGSTIITREFIIDPYLYRCKISVTCFKDETFEFDPELVERIDDYGEVCYPDLNNLPQELLDEIQDIELEPDEFNAATELDYDHIYEQKRE